MVICQMTRCKIESLKSVFTENAIILKKKKKKLKKKIIL